MGIHGILRRRYRSDSEGTRGARRLIDLEPVGEDAFVQVEADGVAV